MEYIIAIVLLLGSFFILLAGVGLYKMPDIFMRMGATTKGATLGVTLILIGTALFFQDFAVTTRSVAIIIFLFLTAPVAAHIIGKVAYKNGVTLWKNTQFDEYSNVIKKSDSETH